MAGALLGFVLLWVLFYAIFRLLPYVSAGADVVFRAKLQQETSGTVFPPDHHARRVLIFGSSKVLAGFVPSYFDQKAAGDGQRYYSYNSGYPAREFFLPQLQKMIKNDSGVPDILLLTLPWQSRQGRFNVFHLVKSDHDLAEDFFPFRYLIRDLFLFTVTSRSHGGLLSFYRESRLNAARMLQDRGYYFITEQSHFANDRLPDDFHLGTDEPDTIAVRTADSGSTELRELNRIVEERHIQCFFVPDYRRAAERAAAPAVDRPFVELLQRYSSCKLLGPDYYSYPNWMFSDSGHLNRDGAKIYTSALYNLLANAVDKGH